MPKLLLRSGTNGVRQFDLKNGVNYIGRGFANDIQVEDPSVSTNHAQIMVDGGEVLIRDNGSTNGTYVAGARISECRWTPGQPLRMGSLNFDIQLDSAVPVAAMVAAVPQVAAVAVAPAAPHAVSEAAIPTPRMVPPAARSSPAIPAPPPPAAPPPTPVAPARSVEGDATNYAEPPKGKTACKFHATTPGQWMCPTCQGLFCGVCVSASRAGGSIIQLCRKCGTVCLPVKVKFVAKKGKELVAYSDGVVLARCFGFGLGAAVLAAGIWTGLSALIGVDFPFLFCPMAGALCGYAVKIASQDRPGVFFSVIAAGYCLLACVIGKVGMIVVTHITINSTTSLLLSAVGLLLSLALAWKLGGGD